MDLLKRLLQGIDIKPRYVAMARGFVEAVVLAGLGAGAIWVNENLIYGAPVALFILRWLEGEADEHIDPTQNRRSEV